MSTSLERTDPETVGVSSQSILDFVDEVENAGLELHSFMLLCHGKVAAEGWWEPYRPEDAHLLYSLSKSFLSTAVGFAVQEGLFDLDDLVIGFFPEDAPPDPSENLKAMQVRHLLSMSVGHEEEPRIEGDNWIKAFLEWPVPREPGTHFLYNSIATFMLSAIVQKTSGITAFDYLKPRLLEPLGIEGATWEANPQGITVGGWGMSVKTEDIAKFGQLYLQKGMWNCVRFLSEQWIDEATKKQVDNSANENPDWKVGYGYQFWRCVPNCYRGDGAFGQYCIVIPEHDMVIAVTACVDNMQLVLDLVWKYLKPSNGSPAENLRTRLDSLELKGPSGSASPSIPGRTYRAMEDSGMASECRFQFDEKGGQFIRQTDGGEVPINFGYQEWVRTENVPFWRGPATFAAKAAWTKPDTIVIRVLHTKEPTTTTYRATFEGDRVKVESHRRGVFLPPEGPTFIGKSS